MKISVFILFCFYSLINSNHYKIEKKINQVLEIDRYYESEEDIQRQVLNCEGVFKLGTYILYMNFIYLSQIMMEFVIFNERKSVEEREQAYLKLMDVPIMIAFSLFYFLN